MKTIKLNSKQILLTAALFGLFILAGNAGATGTGTEVETGVMETVADRNLEVEDWMLNDKVWEATETNFANEFFIEAEESLELENWMTDENNWSLVTYVFTENDEQLNLASWMIQDEYWNL